MFNVQQYLAGIEREYKPLHQSAIPSTTHSHNRVIIKKDNVFSIHPYIVNQNLQLSNCAFFEIQKACYVEVHVVYAIRASEFHYDNFSSNFTTPSLLLFIKVTKTIFFYASEART